MKTGYGISFKDPQNLLCEIKDGNPQEEKYFVFGSKETVAHQDIDSVVVTINDFVARYSMFLWEVNDIKGILEKNGVKNFEILPRSWAASYFFKYQNKLPKKSWIVFDLNELRLTATIFLSIDGNVITHALAQGNRSLGKEYADKNREEPVPETLFQKIRVEELENNIKPLSPSAIRNDEIGVANLLEQIERGEIGNGLSCNQVEKVFVVGSRAVHPELIKILEKSFPGKVEVSSDPITAVSKGAALYSAGLVEQIDGHYVMPFNFQFGFYIGDFESTICKVDINDHSALSVTVPNVVAFTKDKKALVGEEAIEFMENEGTKRLQPLTTETGKNITNVFVYPPLSNEIQGYCPNTGESYTGTDLHIKIVEALKSNISNKWASKEHNVRKPPKNFYHANFIIRDKSDRQAREAITNISYGSGIYLGPNFPYGVDVFHSGINLCTPLTAWLNSTPGEFTEIPERPFLLIDLDYLSGFFHLGNRFEFSFDMGVSSKKLINWCDPFANQILLPWVLERYSLDLRDTNQLKKFLLLLRPYALQMSDEINQLMDKVSENSIRIKSTAGALGVDDQGKPIELDLTISVKQAEDLIRPLVCEAIDEIKEYITFFMNKNELSECFFKCLMIGNSSKSKLIRKMMAKFRPEVCENDNDLLARGAAYLAEHGTLNKSVCYSAPTEFPYEPQPDITLQYWSFDDLN